MQINKKLFKLLFKTFITIAILECIYLFFIPFMLERDIVQMYIQKNLQNKFNLKIQYINPEFKTYIKPALSIKFKEISIYGENSNDLILEAQNPELKISLLPVVIKKLDIKHLFADDIHLNIEKDKDGKFNFEKLFDGNSKKNFKLSYENTLLNIKNLHVNTKDLELNKSFKITAAPFMVENNTGKDIIALTAKGQLLTPENTGDFDINLSFKYPLSYENFDKNLINGTCFIYNLDLKILQPYLQKYFDNNIAAFEGFVDFIQLSAEKDENNRNQIIINTKFNNAVFDKKNWKNHIIAAGENKFNAGIALYDNIVGINSAQFKADNINISANGTITLSKKPELNINAEVKDSRAENIAAILPPTLVPEYMTIEKVKTYGVYGNIEGKANIKGKVPRPDITGYINADDVHVLDKSIHKLHKGTVHLTFDKRILNMDILVELPEKQKTEVKGFVYMYREGINNVSVKTTENIDFPLAQKIIVPISKVFNFQLGPIPDMNIISGNGIIDIFIKGSLDFINIDGFSRFNNARLGYNGLYGEVKNAKGNLDFKHDTINFKSEQAFIKDNPISVEGKVKLNKNMDFNISSNHVKAEDLLELINKSSLLKDVKEGISVITRASGPASIFVNLNARIVPVPFGQPPLPPEEAFEDLKVNGSLYLLGASCNIEGFRTPIEQVKGVADFTESVVNLRKIEGLAGASPLTINGQIITDMETKIPDVDIEITSNDVNLKDTIKFLTQSYLYPENYPNLDSLYKIASKHDLYFKYKAKSVDFLTDKAYAVMNFIEDKTDNPVKAKSGRIVLDKATVKIEDVKADLFDSTLNISGEVTNVDTVNPIYNLKINTDKFNLENINNSDKITILPEQIKRFLAEFYNYKGYSDININVKQNKLNGQIKFIKTKLEHFATKSPVNFDDFTVHIDNNKLQINNLTAQIGDMPFYGDLTISDIYTNPRINGYFTSKVTNNFVKGYLPEYISKKLDVTGDINLSAGIKGTKDNLNIFPKLTLNTESDISYDNVNIGEINDKREFTGNINIQNKIINVKKFDYVKYVSSQNNKTYPINFASAAGIFRINNENSIEPEEITVKTNNNLSARILNLFFKNKILKHGTFNCDLKYKYNTLTKTAKIIGNLDCRNIDILLFDTIIKNVKIKAAENDIKVHLFAFMADSGLNINSVFENNFGEKPKIRSLDIFADQIDNDKLFKSMSQVHKAVNTNNNIKNIDLSGFNIDKGTLTVKKFIIKSMSADNLKSNFSIDENGIFYANDMYADIGQGNINGKLTYNLNNSEAECDFELNDVDSNYIAETLFDGKDQIYGNANGKMFLKTKGYTNEERIKNLSGFVYFDISDGRMPKLGSLEYLLRASNIIKSGITGFTINSILELLNLVKTGYFSNISGSCVIQDGIAREIEIFSKGENLSLYIHGNYDISKTHADMEILGKLSKKISTIFGAIGNTSLNTFFKLIPGISLLDFSRKDFIENVEKIPSFTNGEYESRVFQAIINGNINNSEYVQSFRWVK